ncbi:hypothetical protein C440_14589 [Haloferax mucosum ATCC BAA-1512]|uniref:Uncharacterized protein n=1 Tax=Haloferax mucosum ATCC BAA-1512 TaxID=662479 RepID=M0I453_9EURY|nr:hypothetical protein [Haloferax mucosum]ELZ91550.1 hypothetical protein C440_14589 [Haloferax mucosum ATCC BAA-1512]
MSDRRRDDDILDLLDDLGETLDELGTELRDERERRGDGRDDRRGRRDRFEPPRPPTFGEVMRFTESYTIPTVIAVLEATISSLELLRRLMRLSDPGRAMEDARSETEARMRDVPRSAVSGVERALDELRNALSEADMPSNPEARDIMDRASSLTDELDARIADARDERTDRERRWREDERRSESGWQRRADRDTSETRADRGGRRESGQMRRTRQSGPVRIDVEEASGTAVDDASGETQDADSTTVDVDAELESIKRDVNGPDDGDGEEGDDTDGAEPSDP